MSEFHGKQKRREYFEGWYLKLQTEEFSIGVIPAYHIDQNGVKSVSIQIITEDQVYYLPFSPKKFHASADRFCVRVGRNLFTEQGMKLEIHREELQLAGTVRFYNLSKLRSPIMGPFTGLPMQCSHGVLSMLHDLSGSLTLNGRQLDFNGSVGYLEKDFGRSFPSSYLWTQCVDWSGKKDCSLVAAAADIPAGLFSFHGFFAVIHYHGKEYRLATYLGGRIVSRSPNELHLKQGNLNFHVLKLDSGYEEADRHQAEDGYRLRAPVKGSMERLVKEHISCRVRYRFCKGRQVIFDFVSEKASFEFG